MRILTTLETCSLCGVCRTRCEMRIEYSFSPRKNEHGEYVVKCWYSKTEHHPRERHESGDYFTSSLPDARDTFAVLNRVNPPAN